MKNILIILQLFTLAICIQSQNQIERDKGWKWIVPLSTSKTEVEKIFGQSITKDKKHPFQTYIADFGKITVIYADKKLLLESCSCYVAAGKVISTFISPKRLKLAELNYDLSQYKKDDTFSPRELSYFSEKDGILIATEIVESEDKSKVEWVIAIEYRAKNKH